jgi:hypothetical protein
VSPPKKQSSSPLLDDDIPPPPPPPAVNRKDLPDLPPLHPCSPSCIVKEIIQTGSTNPQSSPPHSKQDKRFKPKDAKEKHNKADKKGRDTRTVSEDENKVMKCVNQCVCYLIMLMVMFVCGVIIIIICKYDMVSTQDLTHWRWDTQMYIFAY